MEKIIKTAFNFEAKKFKIHVIPLNTPLRIIKTSFPEEQNF